MLRNRKTLTLFLFLVLSTFGCKLYSGGNGDDELVFAATEVGTPEGDKVTKNIGPEGGSLASPDGRLTLTVPPKALTETLLFSIQPISNKADGGLGLAYRLEPDGATFTTPVEISVRYNDAELEGTVSEALTLAYQDKQGRWRSPDKTPLDPDAKIITSSTTHFTDWSFLSRLRISPEKATVRVGDTVQLNFVRCNYLQNGMLDRLRRWGQGSGKPCEVTDGKYYWHISANWFADIGTIDKPHELSVIYTAPSRKPSPNIATVSFPYELDSRGDSYAPPNRGMFISKITIIDRGYRATGQDGPVAYSGVICDLEKAFEVTGTHPLFIFPFKFVPSSGVSGKMSYITEGKGISAAGGGGYTITGLDTDSPQIVVDTESTSTLERTTRQVTTQGGGIATIRLVPLETNECN